LEYLPDIETFSLWLNHYGSIALFVLLAMGIVALPVPEETLMVLAGIFISNGEMQAFATIIAACAGSICGISVSYFIGKKAGYYLFRRYGPWLGITERQLDWSHQWFVKFGKWALFIGYFIPGLRHFTGLTAGAAELEFRQFALFAYSGACIWVSLFLSLGYFFGNYGLSLLENYEIKSEEILIIAILIIGIAFIFFLRKKKNQSDSEAEKK
jgi:LPXTG-motif cell wall-anchored protein